MIESFTHTCTHAHTHTDIFCWCLCDLYRLERILEAYMWKFYNQSAKVEFSLMKHFCMYPTPILLTLNIH